MQGGWSPGAPCSEAPKREREEKRSGDPEGPWKASRCLGVGAFSFATPEGRKGSHVPGQQDPGPPGPQPYRSGVPGGSEGHFPHDPGGPPGLLRPSADGLGDGYS